MITIDNKKYCSRCHHLLPVDFDHFDIKYNGCWYNRCKPCIALDREYNNNNAKRRKLIQSNQSNSKEQELSVITSFLKPDLKVDHTQNVENNIKHNRENNNKNFSVDSTRKLYKLIKNDSNLIKIIKKIDIKIWNYQLKNYPKCPVCYVVMIPAYLDKQKTINGFDMMYSVWLYCQNNKCKTFIISNSSKREIMYYYNPWKNISDIDLNASFDSREQWLSHYLDSNKTNILKKTIEWKYLYFWLYYLTNGDCLVKNLKIFKIAYKHCFLHFAKKMGFHIDNFDVIWSSLFTSKFNTNYDSNF